MTESLKHKVGRLDSELAQEKKNVKAALQWSEMRLQDAGVAEPRLEAATLLEFSINRDRTFLIGHPEYRLTAAELELFGDVIRRRAAREPQQYITGIREFYGFEFEVTPDVLIPRPETEMLVTAALSEKGPASICEIGIGSGCISITILLKSPAATALGLDISPAALAVAGRNALKHGVQDRLFLVRSDLFAEAGHRRFDLIVSNPPYVPASDIPTLQVEVRDFEPHIALTDGLDGLSLIRGIIQDAPEYLIPDGRLIFEFGIGQASAVTDMLNAGPWQDIRIESDIQGIPRIASAVLKFS
ncbi:MAG: peptide chain release factor N(5)-glutamine methyltransferase [Acidobacteriota bacterium]